MQKQHEDIVTAEAHLTGLMEELEDAMRRQFNAKFKRHQTSISGSIRGIIWWWRARLEF